MVRGIVTPGQHSEVLCPYKRRFFGGLAPVSAGNLFLLLHAEAARRTALGFAKSPDIEIQFAEDSAQSVSVHAQQWRSLAFVPIGVAKYGQDKLLSKFPDSFGIADIRPIHLQR